MKIAITGANGMLANAYKILAKEYSNLEFMFLDKTVLDITDKVSIDTFFQNNKIEILINCAAYTNVNLAETESEIANAINGYAMKYLAQKCNDHNVTFITYSTDYVFNGTKRIGYNENDVTDPLNAYGKSKELGENIIKENAKKYYIIRTAWLYGPGGNNFVSKIIGFLKEGKELKIVADQFGSPTYTIDLADRTLQIILSPENFPYGIYHITNSGSASWYEFATYFIQLIDKNKEIIPLNSNDFPSPTKRPQFSILINTKISQSRNWKSAVEDYIKNYVIN